ncbi:MAG: hypothetical protein ACFFA6_01175 [Promethearchaeota archaeon]
MPDKIPLIPIIIPNVTINISADDNGRLPNSHTLELVANDIIRDTVRQVIAIKLHNNPI